MNNYDLLEKNEISSKANGGTELMLRSIYNGTIARDLLENFQIIPSRVRDLKEDKIRVMNVHDLPEDPESSKFKDPQFRLNFHKFVFVSNWQYSRYQYVLGMDYSDRDIVIENGIVPIVPDWKSKLEDEKIHLVYCSTPHRGLEILVPVFQRLAEKHPNIHLHVYSSFKIYGWDDADKNFEPLYNIVRDHPQMTYHGFVDNETVKGELAKYHILAYPSIYLETGCRVLMESMSAGLSCVHPNYGALFDTSGSLTHMYHGAADKTTHANIFATNLDYVIEQYKTNRQQMLNRAEAVSHYANQRFDLSLILKKWENTLLELNSRYPAESRSPERYQKKFVYKVI
jgi:UDP-glucose:(glucosyl)LPS alpha-1,2-glucosyltransferase